MCTVGAVKIFPRVKSTKRDEFIELHKAMKNVTPCRYEFDDFCDKSVEVASSFGVSDDGAIDEMFQLLRSQQVPIRLIAGKSAHEPRNHHKIRTETKHTFY
jgi:hypothetical protein